MAGHTAARMAADEHVQSLDRLAGLLGITRSYHDGTGEFRRASDEAVLAIAMALGAPLASIEDAADACRAIEAANHTSAPPPIVVVTEGAASSVAVARSSAILAGSSSGAAPTIRLVLESGDGVPVRVTAGPD